MAENHSIVPQTDEGYGFWFRFSDGETYEGQWKNDKQNCFGVESRLDGTYFEGDFILGYKNGKGMYNWSDGSSYNGEWA